MKSYAGPEGELTYIDKQSPSPSASSASSEDGPLSKSHLIENIAFDSSNILARFSATLSISLNWLSRKELMSDAVYETTSCIRALAAFSST